MGAGTISTPQSVPSGTGLPYLLEDACSAAGRLGHPVLGSFVERVAPSDPLAIFRAARAGGLEPFLWLKPSTGSGLVAVGSARRLDPVGPERFTTVAAAWRDLVEGRIVRGHVNEQTGPRLVGGFAFGPVGGRRDPRWASFGDGSLDLPELLLSFDAGATWLTTSAVVSDDADPEALAARLQDGWRRLVRSAESIEPSQVRPAAAPSWLPGESREHWQSSVSRLVEEIHRGRVGKVVLARQVELAAARAADPEAVVRWLAEDSPEATIFAVVRGHACFLGATPELLVRVRGEVAHTVALAGSAPRGSDPVEDHLLGRELLASVKDADEQAFVVRELRDRLNPLALALRIDSRPRLRRLTHVQHLATEVDVRLRDHVGVLRLVDRLHPTPAVGGAPQEAALRFIEASETFDRGWYAGPVGWVDPNGDGEFVVAIRSGLLEGARATLYAGCGITADSEPAREYEESRLKLRTLASALEMALP